MNIPSDLILEEIQKHEARMVATEVEEEKKPPQVKEQTMFGTIKQFIQNSVVPWKEQ